MRGICFRFVLLMSKIVPFCLWPSVTIVYLTLSVAVARVVMVVVDSKSK